MNFPFFLDHQKCCTNSTNKYKVKGDSQLTHKNLHFSFKIRLHKKIDFRKSLVKALVKCNEAAKHIKIVDRIHISILYAYKQKYFNEIPYMRYSNKS